MSEQTRVVLGDPGNLAVALGTAAGTKSSADFHIWLVMSLPGGLLMGAQPELPTDVTSEQTRELGKLRDHFVKHYFRLEQAERKLATQRKGTSAATAGRRAQKRIEDERTRLGHELHTGVNHILLSAKMQLDELERQLPGPLEFVQDALVKIRNLILQAIDRLRDLSHRVHPPDWLGLSLDEAVRRVWDMTGVEGRYAAELQLKPLPIEPGYHAKTAIYRAAQEGLLNVSRHASPKQVRLSLDVEGEELVLSVFNDGVFSAPDPQDKRKQWGIGLSSIREQVAALGGRMAMLRAGDTFTLEVRVPLYGEE